MIAERSGNDDHSDSVLAGVGKWIVNELHIAVEGHLGLTFVCFLNLRPLNTACCCYCIRFQDSSFDCSLYAPFPLVKPLPSQ